MIATHPLLASLVEEPLLPAADLSPEDQGIRNGTNPPTTHGAGRVTSTVMAKIVGLYDEDAPAGHQQYSAWLDIHNLTPERDVTKPMRWGLELQRAVANARLRTLREQEPEKDWCLLRVPTLIHPQHDWLASSFDYLLLARATGELRDLEIKTGGQWQASTYGEEGTDAVPMKHLVQTTTQMAVLRAHGLMVDRAEVYALIGGQNDHFHPIEWDAELAAELIDRAAAFVRDFVETHTAPPPDGTEACQQYLLDRIAMRPEEPVPATSEMDEAAAVLAACREQKKALKAREDLALSQMLGALDTLSSRKTKGAWGSFSVYRVNGGPVAYERAPYVTHNFSPKKGRTPQ